MIAKDMKRGDVLVYNGSPIIVENLQVQTPSARGAATLYKFRCRNLITKDKVDLKLKGTDVLDEADFRRREVTYTYEMYNIAKEDIAEELNYIKDGLEGIFALIYEERCVAINLPVTVEMLVTKCDPAARGNSATSREKPATTETGLVVMVPEYLEEGEIIKVDTRTGEFLGRANK